MPFIATCDDLQNFLERRFKIASTVKTVVLTATIPADTDPDWVPCAAVKQADGTWLFTWRNEAVKAHEVSFLRGIGQYAVDQHPGWKIELRAKETGEVLESV